MWIDIKNRSLCEFCRNHTCAFLTKSVAKTDFHHLSCETTVCPVQCIPEGPSESDLEAGRIKSTLCINCGLCAILCEHGNLHLVELNSDTSAFDQLTDVQLNAVVSHYLGALFDFAANTNRNRSLLFDGYVATSKGDEAFVEVDWSNDSLETVRRLLGDFLTQTDAHSIRNGIVVLQQLPSPGSRDVFELINKIRLFPTTSDVTIYYWCPGNFLSRPENVAAKLG